MTDTVRVAVTGAGGQIGYSILFRLASGEVFGPNKKVILHLVEVPAGVRSAEGTAMELEDCAFSNLAGIEIHDNPEKGFEGVNWALLIGSKPRGPGMERNDLIKDNGKIFTSQGKALNKAASDLRVIVVGNPCNTNCLIAMHNARDIAPSRFSAMTLLDENRAKAQLAQKAKVSVEAISKLAIWGNHSSTMFPNFEHALIKGEPSSEKLDRKWLEGDFMTTVQKRGAAIIEARGKSSAASAANACIDHVKAFSQATASGEWFSAAIASDGNSYGVPAGLVFSFPLTTSKSGETKIVENLSLSEYAKSRIKITTDELLGERDLVKDLLLK